MAISNVAAPAQKHVTDDAVYTALYKSLFLSFPLFLVFLMVELQSDAIYSSTTEGLESPCSLPQLRRQSHHLRSGYQSISGKERQNYVLKLPYHKGVGIEAV